MVEYFIDENEDCMHNDRVSISSFCLSSSLIAGKVWHLCLQLQASVGLVGSVESSTLVSLMQHSRVEVSL